MNIPILMAPKNETLNVITSSGIRFRKWENIASKGA